MTNAVFFLILTKVEKEDRETIRHISGTVDKILAVLEKPQNRLARIFEMVATGVGVLSILSIIDIIRSWLGG